MVKAQIDPANHPVFLPRLVPHIFDNRQKSRSHPKRRTSSPLKPHPHGAKILEICAIFDSGDPDTAAKIFAQSQRINPRVATSIIAALVNGRKEDQKIMAHLICHLFEIDPLAGNSLYLALFTGQGYDTLVSDSSASGSATASL